MVHSRSGRASVLLLLLFGVGVVFGATAQAAPTVPGSCAIASGVVTCTGTTIDPALIAQLNVLDGAGATLGYFTGAIGTTASWDASGIYNQDAGPLTDAVEFKAYGAPPSYPVLGIIARDDGPAPSPSPSPSPAPSPAPSEAPATSTVTCGTQSEPCIQQLQEWQYLSFMLFAGTGLLLSLVTFFRREGSALDA